MGLWVYAPHLGGKKIPKDEHEKIRIQAECFAITRPWRSTHTLQLRFKNQFCYIEALDKKKKIVFPLCRLRYFDKNKWSLGFFTYSNEKYEHCVFSNGKETGTLEEAIEICEGYLD